MEETEKPKKENNLRALSSNIREGNSETTQRQCPGLCFSFSQKCVVYRCALNEAALEERTLSCGFQNHERHQIPYQIFIPKPTNTAVVRWRAFCIHRVKDRITPHLFAREAESGARLFTASSSSDSWKSISLSESECE